MVSTSAMAKKTAGAWGTEAGGAKTYEHFLRNHRKNASWKLNIDSTNLAL